MTEPDARLDGLSELADEIDRVLARFIEPGEEVAFVNFPNIDNPGDSLLWLGVRAALDRRGARLAAVFEPRTYRPGLLRRAVGEGGKILIGPGGNLGDLYPRSPQQAVRERVLRDFRRASVIQLPQSLYFQRERRAKRFARLATAHDDFTLILREHESVERAAAMGLQSVLCPDIAFALDPIRRPGDPDCDVYWVARLGPEAKHELPELAPGVVAGDFPSAVEQRSGKAGRLLAAELAVNRALVAGARRGGTGSGVAQRLAARRYDALAHQRVRLATRAVARGRALVTDRFHGHALAVLMGIPHVLLDNVYGKNRSLYDAWTSRFSLAHWADEPADAQRIALELAARSTLD